MFRVPVQLPGHELPEQEQTVQHDQGDEVDRGHVHTVVEQGGEKQDDADAHTGDVEHHGDDSIERKVVAGRTDHVPCRHERQHDGDRDG